MATAANGFGSVTSTATYYQDNIPAQVAPGETIRLVFTSTTPVPTNVLMVAGSNSGEGGQLVSVEAFGNGTVTLPPLTIGPSGVYSIKVVAQAQACVLLSGCPTTSAVTVNWPTFVAIGDSYASGAGDKPYGPYAADQASICRRSADNFPSLMNLAPTLVFPACSEANIPSLSQTFKSLPPQLNFLSDSTSLVTVMIGGNDTSVIGITKECMLGPILGTLYPNYVPGTPCMSQRAVPGGPNFSTLTDIDMSNLLVSLTAVYEVIRGKAPHARILAPTYPSAFPPPSPPVTCNLLGSPLTQQDSDFLWQITGRLNTVVETAALDAGIEFVDLNGTGSQFPEHSVCAQAPWFLTPAASLELFTNDSTPWAASMHPNAPGEAEMARLILAALGKGTPLPRQYLLMPLQTVTSSLAVPPGQGTAVFSSSWPGSDIVMSLTSPSGQVINRSTVSPMVKHSLGATFEVYDISVPAAGNWTVDLYGADVAPQGEQVNLASTVIPRAPGDADGDGIATCADMAIVKASFGQKAGQKGFDPRADLNDDGVVNVLDLSLVAKNLLTGVTCQ